MSHQPFRAFALTQSTGCFLTEIFIEKILSEIVRFRSFIAGAFDVTEELEQEGLVRIQIDGFTICGIITGSFATADAAFNPERNTLQLALRS